MHHIELKNLGPIEHCSMDVNSFMVFTGPQSSGKSTLAKAVYFFKSLKGLIFDRALYMLSSKQPTDITISRDIDIQVYHRFHLLLGEYTEETVDANVRYTYSSKQGQEVYLEFTQAGSGWLTNVSNYYRKRIDLINDIVCDFKNSESADYSKLQSYLNLAGIHWSKAVQNVKELLKIILDDTFSDDCEAIYIPAGRSIITTLTDHLAYIFTSMDDTQKSHIDYCTRMYVEQVLKLKPIFATSLAAAKQKCEDENNVDGDLLFAVDSISSNILNGFYVNRNSSEYIQLLGGEGIKLNYASSGQQETVWLFNILFYYLMEGKNVFIVIEEPESHLFPKSQKEIVELICLFSKNGQNQVLLTTHSPYILGSINNLLFASQLKKTGIDTSSIFDKNMLISNDILSSYFIADGKATDCIDSELLLIEQAVIDGASESINDDYERLFQLQHENGEDI